jgi:amidophosphoribosyltransferase
LIAHGRGVDEICELIGADGLIFQDLEDLVSTAHEGNTSIEYFDCSVFDGRYVAGNISQEYLDHLEQIRNDAAKENREKAAAMADNEVIDLHNAS